MCGHALICCLGMILAADDAALKEKAEAARKVPVHSTRTTPEKRVELGNKNLRLDFDPRTSDTSYNFVWVRRTATKTGVGAAAEGPQEGLWERAYNFGIDVRAAPDVTPQEAREPRLLSWKSKGRMVTNFIGMNLELRREGRAMRVYYPDPLIQYRQFDDKIGSAELIRRYPDITREEQGKIVHAHASTEFRYEIDPERPSFTIGGNVANGFVDNITYIIDALWVEDQPLPTHEYIEGMPEIDIAKPESVKLKDVPIEKERYVIFYRPDGDGLPFALLPLERAKGMAGNYFDNWKCLYDFRAASLNQQFVPKEPPVAACNDTGYLVEPKADGTFPAVRVVFFPELGWHAGGTGGQLRNRIIASLESTYLAGKARP